MPPPPRFPFASNPSPTSPPAAAQCGLVFFVGSSFLEDGAQPVPVPQPAAAAAGAPQPQPRPEPQPQPQPRPVPPRRRPVRPWAAVGPLRRRPVRRQRPEPAAGPAVLSEPAPPCGNLPQRNGRTGTAAAGVRPGRPGQHHERGGGGALRRGAGGDEGAGPAAVQLVGGAVPPCRAAAVSGRG